MFYHDSKLQYEVKVDKPDPMFAKLLQQAIGGIEGEMRVCMQYLFQAWGNRGPVKYRDMLMETGTEELAHIEMLATAVALNLEPASSAFKDEMAAESPIVEAIMGGANPRHYLSAGMAALAADANGVPFNGSWIVATGNLAADMTANVMAESTGRVLATRLWNATSDKGMKDMLSFLIARDTMHQNQWSAVLEELGGAHGAMPIPNSFPESEQNNKFAYSFLSTNIATDVDAEGTAMGRWTSGKSIDGKGEFTFEKAMPFGEKPVLGPPHPDGFAQKEQMMDAEGGGFIKNVLKNL
ncbi:MAG TPA: manganese catalase family protein [Flavobacterium sp.]|jgi:Mn-containing catalase